MPGSQSVFVQPTVAILTISARGHQICLLGCAHGNPDSPHGDPAATHGAGSAAQPTLDERMCVKTAGQTPVYNAPQCNLS